MHIDVLLQEFKESQRDSLSKIKPETFPSIDEYNKYVAYEEDFERKFVNYAGKWIKYLIENRALEFSHKNDTSHLMAERIVGMWNIIDGPKNKVSYRNNDEVLMDLLFCNESIMVQGNACYREFFENIKTVGVDITGYKVKCYDCNEPMTINVKWNVITIKAMNGCTCKSNRYHKCRVSFPSGKVVANDDMQLRFTIEDQLYVEGQSLPQPHGKEGLLDDALLTQYYAQFGVAYHLVGNTCPSIVMRDGVMMAVDERKKGDKKLTHVVTDSWSTTLIDYDHYIQAVMISENKTKAEAKQTIKDNHCTVFSIEPGTYEFTAHTMTRRALGLEDDILWSAEKVS